mmetsp:Transcript_18877/g.47178  ORF Transcript_18877/g.47178 Transcript_18877/m.47178 type:complete len:314 (+) Transcript_18877:186-1127(+)|eukprot:CAMPEP_0179008826 /NCGR_PEP_ID=MMETSP0795-20121207/15936_1 /TAXON_ID=88552 /ORGANISM="Amoebophrya sp., Strain Ameob2" /LENGTH=313 /DNA_ID=CAMNT_0020703963 /DNA_START=154 /DNA_END=1095 /DNA_ORIENTATION=-
MIRLGILTDAGDFGGTTGAPPVLPCSRPGGGGDNLQPFVELPPKISRRRPRQVTNSEAAIFPTAFFQFASRASTAPAGRSHFFLLPAAPQRTSSDHSAETRSHRPQELSFQFQHQISRKSKRTRRRPGATSFGLGDVIGVPRLYAAVMRGVKSALCSGKGEFIDCRLNKYGTEIERCDGYCGLFGLIWWPTKYKKNCKFKDLISYPWSAHRGPTYGADPVYKQVRRQACCSNQCWDIDDWRVTLSGVGGGVVGGLAGGAAAILLDGATSRAGPVASADAVGIAAARRMNSASERGTENNKKKTGMKTNFLFGD